MEKKMETTIFGLGFRVKGIEYGVYGDLIIKYPKPYSIYLRGTVSQPALIENYLRFIGPSTCM